MRELDAYEITLPVSKPSKASKEILIKWAWKRSWWKDSEFLNNGTQHIFFKVCYKMIFLYLTILSLFACTASREVAIGMNSHVAYSLFDDTRHDEVKSMSEMGLKIIRIDWQGKVVPSQDDKNLKRFDESLAYFTKYGIETVIVFPTMPSSDEEIKSYANLIEFIAKRYNGKTAIDVDGEQFRPIAKYFQIGNEMHFQRRNNPFVNNQEALWKINKLGSQAVRKVRKDAVIIWGAIYENSSCQEYVDWLCSYQDSDGTTIGDLFDIVSIHFYKDDIVDLQTSFGKMYEMIKATPLKGKPIWITECGMNTYEYSESQQSTYVSPAIITLLSTGADKCFWYTYRDFGGNLFSREMSINNREDYFGIIRPSVVYPSVSFLCNDGSKKAISKGDALNQVLAKFPWKNRAYVDMPMGMGSDVIINNLKKTGLYLQGSDVSISKIVKQQQFESDPQLDRTIYEPLKNESKTEVHIPSSFFSDIKKGDVVRVYLDYIKETSGKWNFDPKPVYFNLCNLLSLYNDYCTKPIQISTENGLFIWKWKNINGDKLYAVRSSRPKQLKISSRNNNYKILDSKGNDIPKKSDNAIEATQSLIYIIDSQGALFYSID